MDDVCQIIFEQGGYRMAWIGVACHDQEKRIVPVAQAGFGTGYLTTATIRWDNSQWGKDPAGTAIRTGEPIVVSALHADPSFVAWRAEAEKRGYRLVMSLPLIVNGERYGALFVYSTELDAFDVEEVALFVELVEDVAYVLESLRNRGRRPQAERQLAERERLIVLHEIEQAILATRSPISTAQATLHHLHNLIPYQRGMISLFDYKREEIMLLAATASAEGKLRPRERLPLMDGESLRKLEAGRHVLIPDLQEQVGRSHVGAQLWQEGMRSLLSIPLLSRNKLVGELALAADEPAAFIHDHVQIAYEVAASLSFALQNALLFEETERRAQELEALTPVSAAMRTAEESPGLLSAVAMQAALAVTGGRD